jgi:hypothetical protein
MKGTSHQNLAVRNVLVPASYAAAAELFTSGIDCQGYDEALFIFHIGTATATGDLTMQVEESSDDAVADPYADVTGAAVSEITVSNDNTVYVARVDLTKRERWLRVGYDVDDDNVIFGITVVFSQAKVYPVTQTNTASFNL